MPTAARKLPFVSWFGLVLVVAAVGAISQVQKYPVWSPDGFIYTRMMLSDGGLSPDQARAVARDFYRTTNEAKIRPELFTDEPPAYFQKQDALFAARVLYPYLASRLYPVLGLKSLLYVSAMAYVAAGGALFVLVLCFAPPWLAALTSVGTLMVPLVRTVSGAALTDSLSLFLWICVLLTMILYLKGQKPGILIAAAVAAILLVLARPAMYLPAGAAGGLLVASLMKRDQAGVRIAMSFAGIVGASLAAYALTVFVTHAPGLRGQLGWIYQYQRDTIATTPGSFWPWYVLAVLKGVALELALIVYNGTPLFAVCLASLGLYLKRNDRAIAILLGATAMSCVVFFVNPFFDLNRTFELPLYPVVAVGFAIATNTITRTALLQTDGGDRAIGPGEV